MKKRWVCGILSIVLILVNITSIWAGSIPDKKQITGYLDEISRYELKTVTNPAYGSVGGEWSVMALARYGTITDSYTSTYRENLKKKLKEESGVLSQKKYTEYARVVIALTAIEENPENFAGYNLLRPLAELDNITRQGANGILYTLIALDCGAYEIPAPEKEYEGRKTTRERLVNLIVENQLDDGGWTFAGTKSDTDMTAMALQALAPYYKQEEKVKKAVDTGLKRLGELQQKDGGYRTGNLENCESTAQVLTALSVLHISLEDARFVKNGNTVMDGLLKYYNKGAFCHLAGGGANQMATEQAMYAMTAYYRSISGMNGLFEMKDGITKRKLAMEEATTGSSSKAPESEPKKKTKSKKQSSGSVATEKNSNVESTVAGMQKNGQADEKETTTTKEKKTEKENISEVQDDIEESGQSKKAETTEEAGSAVLQKKENRSYWAAVAGVACAAVLCAAGLVLHQRKKGRSRVS